jgi:GntR family transcriptional regulator, transcriptional repressor for pyruvate dehydrogenase complex
MNRGSCMPEENDALLERLQPIQAQSVPDVIQRKIVELLADSKLVAGDRLPAERDLATALGVSRTTLRDALRGLEQRGVLRSRAGSGWYVNLNAGTIASSVALHFQLSELAVEHLYEARQAIEPVIAFYAAMRRSEEDIAGLERLIALMASAKDGASFLGHADTFHAMIASATHNPFFALTIDPVFKLQGSSRQVDTAWSWSDAMKEHKEIMTAIRSADGLEAAEAMARHMGAVKTRVWLR